MDTQEIMKIALDLCGLNEIPKDSAIHVPGRDIKRVLFSLDVDVAELALARQMRFDLVIAHHPIGPAPGGYEEPRDWYEVVERHYDFMIEHGVPNAEARRAVEGLKHRLMVQARGISYGRVVGAAKALGMPLINVHLPCDELGRRRIIEHLPRKSVTVGELMDRLGEMPEFDRSKDEITLALGSRDAAAGRVAVAHAAGTNGGYLVAKAYFYHGTSTVLYIRIEPAELERLKNDGAKGSLILLGHTACDSLGINPFLAKLRSSGLEVKSLGVVEV